MNGPRMMPIEKRLRIIAKMEGAFVVAVLDCCREKVNEKEWRGGGAGA